MPATRIKGGGEFQFRVSSFKIVVSRFAFRVSRFQQWSGFGDETGGGIGFPGVGDVEHEVGDAGAGGGIRLGGADVHGAVDLHGVDGHDRCGG